MRKMIRNAIITMADYWELTPTEAMECILQVIVIVLVTVTMVSIRPFCWAIVKIAELIGKI